MDRGTGISDTEAVACHAPDRGGHVCMALSAGAIGEGANRV